MKDLFTLWMESLVSTQIGRRVDIPMPQDTKPKTTIDLEKKQRHED